MTRPNLRWPLLAVLLLTSAALAETHLVDPGGGPGAALLQSTVDAAAPGDVVLLAPGDYLAATNVPIFLVGKGLTLAPDAGTGPVALRGLFVDAVPEGQTAAIRDFVLQPLPTEDFVIPFTVRSCKGGVLLEGLEVAGVNGIEANPSTPGRPAGLLLKSRQVTLTRCSFQGGTGLSEPLTPGQFASQGAAGLRVEKSTATLSECQVFGGAAGTGTPNGPATNGGDGVRVSGGSWVWLNDSAFAGGTPGTSTPQAVTNGGDGIHLLSNLDVAWRRGGTSAGGPGGVLGISGQAVQTPGGSFFEFLEAPGGLVTSPGVVRPGDNLTLDLVGPEGAAAWVLISFGARWVPYLDAQGFLLVDPVTLLPPQFLALLGGDGQASVQVAVPDLPGGVQGGTLVMQPFFLGDVITLGGLSSVSWVPGI